MPSSQDDPNDVPATPAPERKEELAYRIAEHRIRMGNARREVALHEAAIIRLLREWDG